MITIIEGDLLQATENIIGHQVNCMSVMGSGIAKQIRDAYPSVYSHYEIRCMSRKNPIHLLGDFQIIKLDKGRYVANLFGQLNFGYNNNKQYTDYCALANSLITLRKVAEKSHLSVALPYKIGCARGGGDWEGIVLPMLKGIFDGYSLTLYKWEG